MIEFLHAHVWLLAIAIFLARVGDVSLGTFRTIVVFRGYALLAAGIGFFEILLWVAAASQVLTNLHDWYLAVAYAGGFAAGNYVGIRVESALAMGDELVRAISFRRGGHLAGILKAHGFDPIVLEGGTRDERPVEVVIVVAGRRRMPSLIRLIRQHDPEAIYTVNDVKRVYNGVDIVQGRRVPFFAGWRARGKRK